MMRYLLRLLSPYSAKHTAVILLAIAMSAAATWVPLNGIPTHPTAPEVKLVRSDYQSIHLILTLDGFYQETVSTRDELFSSINLVGEGYTTTVGAPALPVLRRLIEIPYGAKPELKIASVETQESTLGEWGMEHPILPVQPLVEKRLDAFEQTPWVLDKIIYQRKSFAGSPVARLAGEGYVRGHHFVMLEIFPFDYSPADGRLRLRYNIRLQINLPGADPAATRTAKSRLVDYQTQRLVQRLVVNPQSYRGTDLIPPPLGLLIITSPTYASLPLLDDFMAWKEQKGYHTTLATTLQTGTSAQQIKAFIQNAYDAWPIPPNFVLLIGDVDAIPCWSGQMPVSPITDLYYSTLEGNDCFPDVGLGRFSVSDSGELINILNKSLNYEQALWIGDRWEKAAVFMASNDNWWITEATHDSVITNYLEPEGYRSAKLYSHSSGATTQQVTTALNTGGSLAIYAGHGYFFCWLDGPLFTQHNVEALTNVYYPFVGSFACDTGQFPRPECFGETWLRVPHGAIAFWGAAATSFWIPDDILERALFEGFFDEQMQQQDQNLTWIAGMTNYAKFMHWVLMGGGQMGQYYWELYNVLGDPTVDLWTDVPQDLTVNIPATVQIGQSSLTVSVSGYPDWAMVNVYSDAEELQFTDYVTNGSVTFNLGSGFTVPGAMHVWVTGHDCRPYHGTAAIVADGRWSLAAGAEEQFTQPKATTISIQPNPFNPSTVIRYQMPEARFVSLRVYDTAGRLVARLVEGWRGAGVHEVTFDGTELPSGIYLAKLVSSGRLEVAKLALIK